MVHIQVKRGLDIPIQGAPLTNTIHTFAKPKQVALNLEEFSEVKFRPLVKVGDTVQIGQPLCEDKDVPGRMFVSPAQGHVFDIRRGEKRKLLAIVIDVDEKEEHVARAPLKLATVSRNALIEFMLETGLFVHIHQRPFKRLAHPAKLPRSIFVKALESAPFVPSCEAQVQGYEHEFQVGLNALKMLTDGPVHLVMHKNTTCKAFLDAKNVVKHTAEGPHPVANHSLHIGEIDPIEKTSDVVWTVDVVDVVAIGHLIEHGKMKLERIVTLAGSVVDEKKRGLYKVRQGMPIAEMIASKMSSKEPVRWISGNVLTGHQVQDFDFLGFYTTCLTALSDTTSRQFLSFFRLGADKYTASGAYLSGHLNPKTHFYNFTTSQHGEERAFIDGSVYERVMPLKVLPMQLVRAVMAEDYELAQEYGLLEVDSEDFALCEFVCPSKIEMVEIVKNGLKQYAKEVL
jgi:Na+-transporting NADH:ubiquinone oxidoreductase subunit A